MNYAYILTVVKEFFEDSAEVQSTLYGHIDDALHAYSAAVDEARNEAEERFAAEREAHEISTEDYRWFRIYDGCDGDSITIEVRRAEIIETEREI